MPVSDVINSDMTISDKIRALDAAGHTRADIARLLHRRYQHVRNVLEADKARGETPRPSRKVGVQTDGHAIRFKPDGDLLIPAEMVAGFKAQPGDTLVAQVEDDRIVLMTRSAALARARALVRSLVPEGVSLSDELVKDRRLEARREEEGG
jgi:antitoxin component of MazEF toxin-antitoxin module